MFGQYLTRPIISGKAPSPSIFGYALKQHVSSIIQFFKNRRLIFIYNSSRILWICAAVHLRIRIHGRHSELGFHHHDLDSSSTAKARKPSVQLSGELLHSEHRLVILSNNCNINYIEPLRVLQEKTGWHLKPLCEIWFFSWYTRV